MERNDKTCTLGSCLTFEITEELTTGMPFATFMPLHQTGHGRSWRLVAVRSRSKSAFYLQ